VIKNYKHYAIRTFPSRSLRTALLEQGWQRMEKHNAKKLR